jgi:hypothetical protein
MLTRHGVQHASGVGPPADLLVVNGAPLAEGTRVRRQGDADAGHE